MSWTLSTVSSESWATSSPLWRLRWRPCPPSPTSNTPTWSVSTRKSTPWWSPHPLASNAVITIAYQQHGDLECGHTFLLTLAMWQSLHPFHSTRGPSVDTVWEVPVRVRVLSADSPMLSQTASSSALWSLRALQAAILIWSFRL